MNIQKTISLLVILVMQVCTIVYAQQPAYPIDTINGTAVYRYPVEKSIGLYRISVNFKVSQEEIIQWNPSIKNRGLRYDDVLLIPVKEDTAPTQKTTDEPVAEATIPAYQANNVQHFAHVKETENLTTATVQALGNTLTLEDTSIIDIPTIKLCMLLPLQTGILKRDQNMDRFYDFYTGALIAIYEAQQSGQKIEVYTYDIDKTDSKIRQLIQDSDKLAGMDVVIGTAYSGQVSCIANWAKNNHVKTLLPFSSTVPDLENNPYVIQFNSDPADEAVVLADSLEKMGNKVNCVLIQAKEQEIPESIRLIRNELNKRHVPCTYTTIHDILNDSAQYALKDSVENIFIFNTEKQSNLQAVLPHLKALRIRNDVTIFSRYSWQKDNIQLPQIYTSVFHADGINEDDYQQLFSKYFGHKYASTQPRFDLLGYDLIKHTLSILSFVRENGDESQISQILEKPFSGVQSDIQYIKERDGGYKNRRISVIRQ